MTFVIMLNKYQANIITMKKNIIPPLNMTFGQAVKSLVKERPKKNTKKEIKRARRESNPQPTTS